MSFEIKPLKLRVVGCETFASRLRRWVVRLRKLINKAYGL